MNDFVKSKLDEIQRRTHADSYAEVVRRALALYERLLSLQAQGGRLLVQMSDDDEDLKVLELVPA